MRYFLFNLFMAGRKDAPECQRYGNVPFENEVFVDDSPQDTHGEYEDEQLTTIQKRICLIEFLFMVGLFFVEEGAPTTKFKPPLLWWF